LQDLLEALPDRDYDHQAVDVLRNARRVVEVDGNHTTVVYVNKDGGVVSGWAKRNPNADPKVPERGERIATVRAYRKFREQGWQ